MASEEPGSPPAPRVDLDPQITAKLEQMFADGLCKPSDVDGKVRAQLRVLSVPDALDALVRMENALKTGPVHKFSAYLASVIRRITQVAPEASGAPVHLHPQAQDILERLYNIGLVRRGDLDGRALAALGAKPPELQLLVMETFRDRNLRGIRNMAAFFTSHQSQVDKDLREGTLRLPRLGAHPPPSPRYGGPRPPGPSHGYDPAYPHGGPPPSAPHGGYGGPPPPSAGGGSYPQHRPPYAPQAQAPYPSMPPAPAPALPQAPSLPKDLSTDQAAWGIRIDEFHGLSAFAKYVSPAAALRLQQLWDVEQNKLVSVLNEASWEALAGLDGASGVAAVNSCADAMKTAPDDLATVNSIFISIAAKYPKRPDAPSLATLALATVGAAAPHPAPQAPPQPQYAPPLQQQYAPAPAPAPQQPPSPYRGGPPPSYGAAPPPYSGPPPYGGPPPPQPNIRLPGPCGSLLPSVQAEIDRILRQWGGLLKLVHFEGRAVDMLHRIGERNALAALEEFGRNDPQHMRSPTAYLIGCIKKFGSEGDVRDGRDGGPGGGPGGPPGGGHDDGYHGGGGGYRGGRGGRGGRRGGRGRGRYGGRDGDRDGGGHWAPY